ncbi:ABC transporter substrate-binding protein [Gordonibacter urolithinfaciens]|uniref:ABC transporter substrate-binding protein n=1 Tax=Gordonibacter urolithinfaciens TaxID=1335613 RepID=A0A6N8IGI4_9ACTN|nr:ABC transporter substrate-binding protein [Gordonibacter urolithinfaciens]MVM55138.1 ABC transporter substrate-binding protein [Gordonibacter urolithinfaciens]MVN14917.1 ABC transporter substrate-binding protein [Gordonibacter urolithinfaciens]MVN39759.1 ABC transporter substrate-binding protein [Gordonibacter urolithinfaciens]MVN56777.1 ABC transporter substrate-binding protein [Gordonibacter urolithinfaciens]MVN62258.1 ABC transporter substrate-binding protein [Gordonibacter urolithinfaci
MESKSAFSRRQFMELLGVSAAGFGLVSMAGCGGGDDAKKDEGADAPAAGGTADTITYSLTADPRAVDPAYFDDGESAVVSCNMYEGLYQYGKTDAKVSPCLAKDLPEISDDGLVYTIKLNEGIKFHDGTDFNADAVKKSIERQLEPNRNSNMPYASFVFGEEEAGNGVASVEAVDDYTVKITMRTASAPFVKNLAMALASPIVAPSAIEAATDGQAITNPVGTGPYKFVDWTKGASVTLVANEDYWGEAPKTKNLVFKIIAEGNTRLTSLINGECDIISSVDPASADQIVDNGFELFSEDGMTINYMAFNTETGKCTDQEVRKAVAQAINVEEMVKSIYGDYATVANSVMPTWMAPYTKDVKQTAYDPEAAKKTLADKGITSLQCITYTTARPYNQKGGSDLANMIQGYLSAVGVELSITQYDWTTYKTKVQTDPYDICFYGWTGDNGDPDNFMNLLADTNWSINVAHWQDDEYKALIAEGLKTPDGDARDAIYLQCEEMVAEKQPWVLISHSKNLLGYSPKVKDFYYHPTGVVFFKGVSKEA